MFMLFVLFALLWLDLHLLVRTFGPVGRPENATEVAERLRVPPPSKL